MVIWTSNVRGIATNFDFLAHSVFDSLVKPDLIFLNETLIAPRKVPSSGIYDLEGYSIFRQDRRRGGGGNMVYYRSDLPFTILRSNDAMQYQWYSLKIQSDEYLICHLYRPPGNDCSIFDHIGADIESLGESHASANFLLLGDFNCHNREWLGGTCEDNIAGQAGEMFACEHGFDQLVTEATRVYTYRGVQKESVLDLCLTDVPDLLSFTGNLSNIGSSDHKLVSLALKVPEEIHLPREMKRLGTIGMPTGPSLNLFYLVPIGSRSFPNETQNRA